MGCFSSCFSLYQELESTFNIVSGGPEMVYSASRGDSQSILHGAVSLTSTDGGKVPHVVEEFADDRTGPGVQPMTVDAQVELDPAGLQLELQWGVQGSEVQLLFVYLVSSERAEGFHYVF